MLVFLLIGEECLRLWVSLIISVMSRKNSHSLINITLLHPKEWAWWFAMNLFSKEKLHSGWETVACVMESLKDEHRFRTTSPIVTNVFHIDVGWNSHNQEANTGCWVGFNATLRNRNNCERLIFKNKSGDQMVEIYREKCQGWRNIETLEDVDFNIYITRCNTV